MIINCLAVGIGGFIGSIARYLVSFVLNKGNSMPIGTLLVNVVGAVMIGFIISFAGHTDMSEEKLLFLRVGLCGGLTTFSTFSLETYRYFEAGNYLAAIGYSVLSIVICVFGVMIGIKLGR